MLSGPMRLRRQRSVYARRRSGQWRLPVAGGILVLLIGAACWAPNALAPLKPADQQPMAPIAQAAPGAALAVPVAGLPPSLLGAAATPTPLPTRVPTPVV